MPLLYLSFPLKLEDQLHLAEQRVLRFRRIWHIGRTKIRYRAISPRVGVNVPESLSGKQIITAECERDVIDQKRAVHDTEAQIVTDLFANVWLE